MVCVNIKDRDVLNPKKLQYKNRWFTYFDLLGFSNLVRQHRIEDVLPTYEDALRALEQKTAPNYVEGISYSWFSDTFIIFSSGDSDRDFSLIEHVSRLFFQELILKHIPVRGSLTIGPLYTQKRKNIFLGEALIDAYEYGEKQNWLGFVLTSSVYEHLKEGDLALEQRPFYRRVEIPGIITHPKPDNVFAFAFNNGQVNGRNPYIRAIQTMKGNAGQENVPKYENTEKFIQAYGYLK